MGDPIASTLLLRKGSVPDGPPSSHDEWELLFKAASVRKGLGRTGLCTIERHNGGVGLEDG